MVVSGNNKNMEIGDGVENLNRRRVDSVVLVTIILSHGHYVCMGINICRSTTLLSLHYKQELDTAHGHMSNILSV